MSWTEQRFKQAVRRGELKYYPKCARSFLYFKARKEAMGDREREREIYEHFLSEYKLKK